MLTEARAVFKKKGFLKALPMLAEAGLKGQKLRTAGHYPAGVGAAQGLGFNYKR